MTVIPLLFIDCFSVNDVDDLMSESEKMRNFSHPNILSLIGVCIDAGEAPYIVMPFMSNGSLLTYLRKERPHFTIADEAEQETVCNLRSVNGKSRVRGSLLFHLRLMKPRGSCCQCAIRLLRE